MLPWDKKRQTVTMIMHKLSPTSNVGSMKMQEKSKNLNGDELSVDSGMESAAQNMISAFHSKDSKRLVQALCDFLELHMQYEGDDNSSMAARESHDQKY